MDSKSKKININNNLLVGLKAELLRKQEHIKKPALEKTTTRFRYKNNNEVASSIKKNKSKAPKEPKQNVQSNEEIAALENSRKNLEKKAKLYEQMTQNVISMDDTSKLPFLVDFEQKAIDEVRDLKKTNANFTRESDSDEDGEWVDYTDSFGRSRKCLKKDLPHFKEMDKNLAIATNAPKRGPIDIGEPQLLSSDMRREIERQKWEEAVNEMRAKENVHYSDVTFNEIRDHGVGFFSFSKDEQTRKEQMDLLNKLREQTKTQRKMFTSMKEKKRKMLEIRLAKIMQRRVIQEAIKVSGLDPHTLIAGLKEDEEELEVDQEVEGLIGDPIAEPQEVDDSEVTLLTRDDSWRRDAPVREWDVGKKTFDQEGWLDKRREERMSEFAPVYGDSVTNAYRNTAKNGDTHNVEQDSTNMQVDADDMVALNLRKLRMLIT